MAWKANDVMDQRFRFVVEGEKDECSLAELCREFEIARQTGYKWLARYEVSIYKGRIRRALRAVQKDLADFRRAFPLPQSPALALSATLGDEETNPSLA